MAWKKGESGNPKGRPPKKRTLSEILEKVGNTKLNALGEQVASKKLLAALVWQAATMGAVMFPGQEKAMVLESQDWLGVVKFLYGQIDGPPKNEVDVTTNGNDLPGVGVVVVLPDNGRNDRD